MCQARCMCPRMYVYACAPLHLLLTATSCFRLAMSLARGPSSSKLCAVSPCSRAALYQCTVTVDSHRQLGLHHSIA